MELIKGGGGALFREKIVAEAETRHVQLENDLQELRRQKFQFEATFRSMLDSCLKMISINERNEAP